MWVHTMPMFRLVLTAENMSSARTLQENIKYQRG